MNNPAITPEKYARFLEWEREEERKANEAQAQAKVEALGPPLNRLEPLASDKPATTPATERLRNIPMQRLKDEGQAMQRDAKERARAAGPDSFYNTVSPPPDPGVAGDRCLGCLRAERYVRSVHPGSDTHWGRLPGPVGSLHAYDSQSNDPYHLRFKRELMWVAAWEQADAPPLVYLAHPVSGDFTRNIERARDWLGYLRGLDLGQLRDLSPNLADLTDLPSIQAPWLALPFNGDVDRKWRRFHMAGCRAMASRFDEVWVLNRWSSGVSDEARAGRRVRDLTGLGPRPPKQGGS